MEYQAHSEYSSHDMETALRAQSAARRAFGRIALAEAVYTAVAYVAVFLIYFIVMVSGLANTPFVQANAAAIDVLLSTLPMYLFAFPVFYLLLRRLPTFPLTGERPTWRMLGALFLVSRFFILVGSTVSSWMTTAVGTLLGYELTDTTTELVMQTPVWLLILIVVVIGPIMEEIMYRKLMIDRLAAFGDIPAILFSSVLFGIGHGNLFQFVYAALLGLILGYIYTKTGKLTWCIALHMLTNFLGSIAVLPLIGVQESILAQLEAVGDDITLLLTGDAAATFLPNFLILSAYSAIEYALAIAGAVFFFIYLKRLRFAPRLLERVGARPMAKSAVCNVGVLIFAAVALVQFILSVLPS